jgi:hypothetical protein
MIELGWTLTKWVTVPLTLFVIGIRLAVGWQLKRGRR